MVSVSVLVTILMFGPSSEHVAEVEVPKESESKIDPERDSLLFDALSFSLLATHIGAEFILDPFDAFIHLCELFWAAFEGSDIAMDDVVSVDTASSDENGAEPDHSSAFSGVFAWDEESVKEGTGHEACDSDFDCEQFGPSWIKVDVDSGEYGTENCEEGDCFHTAFDWEAEAAGFTHMSISINKNYKNTKDTKL